MIELAPILAAPCPGCGGRKLRVRALATGALPVMHGEPVGTIAWLSPEPSALEARAVRVECVDCKRLLAEDPACPLCRAPGGAERAFAGRHGMTPPAACPRCDYEELEHRVEVRMHALFLAGTLSRRVLDADPQDPTDPGWHVVECRCPNCEEIVAAASTIRCAACGKSSLVRPRVSPA